MKSPEVLFLDLDETLLDCSRLPQSIDITCNRVAARYPALDAARVLAAYDNVWKGYWPNVAYQWTLGTLDSVSLSLEAWRSTLAVCGCNDNAVAEFASQTQLQLARKSYRLFDDVHELFSYVKRVHIPVVLITNGAADTQREKLSALGIEQHFYAIVISGEVGIAKPDASVFGLALDRLDVQRENVWHVGDSLIADVAGAKAADLVAVWLNRKGLIRREDHPEPDLEIFSFVDLVDMLKTWLSDFRRLPVSK